MVLLYSESTQPFVQNLRCAYGRFHVLSFIFNVLVLFEEFFVT